MAVAAIRAADARRSPAPDRVLLFHIVTLPVEYDASFRAMRILEGSGIVATDEMPGVKKTLYAAGFTYVAATLVALAHLAYYVMLLAGNDDRRFCTGTRFTGRIESRRRA